MRRKSRTNKVIKKRILFLLLRYLILFLLGLGNLWLISVIATPITVGAVFVFLKVFFDKVVFLGGSDFIVRNVIVELIPACVGVAGYYLLLILNLTTPMGVKKRIKSLAFLLGGFFIFNIMRIIIFTFIFLQGYYFFDAAHEFTWYLGSTIFVVVLWFVNVWIFKIKKIPFVDDVKWLRSYVK